VAQTASLGPLPRAPDLDCRLRPFQRREGGGQRRAALPAISREAAMIRSLCVLALIASAAAAQVPLSGDVYDGHGGPLATGVVYVSSGFVVPAGTMLTLEAGTILKMDGGSVVVDGALQALGSWDDPALRVTITSILDDVVGGDTNGDGTATEPQPTDWGGIVCEPGSQVWLLASDVAYYGAGLVAGVECHSPATLGLDSTVLANGGLDGINFRSEPVSDLSINEVTFRNNNGYAIARADIDVLGHVHGCTAVGNAWNIIDVVPSQVQEDFVRFDGQDFAGGVVVLDGACSVPAGHRLELVCAVVKMYSQGALESWGRLDLIGNQLRDPPAPTVLTSMHDDTWGGDSDGNGSMILPMPGDWHGVTFQPGSGPNRIDLALIRYPGAFSNAGLACKGDTSVTRTRVDHARSTGFALEGSAAAVFDDLVAFDCREDGIKLLGGDAVLRRCTSASSGHFGMRALAPFSGTIASSIAWNSGTQDWSGLVGGVSHCDGHGVPAGPGNLDADPLFRDSSSGDLRLDPGSPCIDAGDPADQPGNPAQGDQPGDLDQTKLRRLVDGSLDAVRVVDMGAFEYSNVELQLAGVWAPLEALQIDTTCRADFDAGFMLAGSGSWDEKVMPHFGVFTLEASAPILVVPWLPATATTSVQLPAEVGDMLTLQFCAFVHGPHGIVGNLSEARTFAWP
jgi:hypothetical protein